MSEVGEAGRRSGVDVGVIGAEGRGHDGADGRRAASGAVAI